MSETCNNCGSKNLTWHCQAQNRSSVVDGRICMRDVGVIFFLGCDKCSETVKIIDGDVVAVALTADMQKEREAGELREALRFYASKRNYEGSNQPVEKPQDENRGGGYRLDVTWDRGAKARTALKNTEPTKS